MVRLARILRDYQDAGNLNGLLALWGFVDDTAFVTKAGHLGVAYRLRGVDVEGLTHAQRHALVHRFEAAIQQRTTYLNSRRHELYDLGVYVVVMYEAPTVARTSTQLRHLWRAPRQ